PAVSLVILWSFPALSAVSGHPLHCLQSLVIPCTVRSLCIPCSVRSLWSSPLCPHCVIPCTVSAVLVIPCTVSAVFGHCVRSGHLLYYVRSLGHPL
ncbi:unnamed protein product, partial [Staurois parvus]